MSNLAKIIAPVVRNSEQPGQPKIATVLRKIESLNSAQNLVSQIIPYDSSQYSLKDDFFHTVIPI